MKHINIIFLIIISCGYPSQYKNDSGGSDEEKNSCMGIEIYLPGKKLLVNDQMQAQLLAINSAGEKTRIDNVLVNWQSNQPKVASIDAAGMVTALSGGDVVVTAGLWNFSSAQELHVDFLIDYTRIVLSEIFYDSVGSDTGKEFIEIKNINDYECDISGFQIIDGAKSSSPFIFPDDSIIAARALIILAQSKDGFTGLFGFNPDYSGFSFTLNNDGETVFLLFPDGSVRDFVYIEGGSKDFPVTPEWGSSFLPQAVEGNSIQRIYTKDTCNDWISNAPTPGK
jgi:hypothetical protein